MNDRPVARASVARRSVSTGKQFMTMQALWRRATPAEFAAAGLAVLGTCIAVAAALWLHRQNAAQAGADFERSAARVAQIVESRLRQPIYGLRGAGGVYAANSKVLRQDFRAYVESRDLPHEFPGVRGFGFIQRVPRSDLAAFVAATRADGAPQFAVRELDAPGRDDLYVIKYIEPFVPNLPALGLDVGSEPVRRAAAELAVATGLPTLTAAITLVQDNQRRAGFLLFVPIFRQGADPTTPAQRKQALVGLLYAPMVVDEMLAAVPDVAAGLANFQLIDLPHGAAVFDSSGHSTRSAADAGETVASGRFRDERRLSLPGRDALLRVRSTPQFDAAHRSAAPALVLVVGIAGSGLLAALLSLLLRQQASMRSRAEALAENLTQVVRYTHHAVLTTDLTQRIVWVNDGYARLTGVGADQVVGDTTDLVFGDGAASAQALQVLDAAITSGQGCRVELPLRAWDDSAVWLDLEVQPLRDAYGAITGYMHIGSDITAQRLAKKRLEAALRENEALLRVIHLHAIVSVADSAGQIIEVNDAFCRISGYSREELLAHTHRIVKSGMQPDSLWVDAWKTITAGQPWRSEVCNRSKDGTLYWVDTMIAPFVDAEGRIEKYISIRTDITARKNAARELARERQRLDNILEGTNVGTWEWNVETGAMTFNERWAQIVGRTLAELVPTTVQTWSELTHPDDLSGASARLEQHFNGELEVYECEVRLKHKTDGWVWALSRGKLFSRGDDGRPRWMAGTLMDITERRKADAALRASQALLDKTGRIAGVGGWALELASQTVQWSDQTCRIHDRQPGHQPSLDEAIGHYPEEVRHSMLLAVQHCIDTGEGFDLELPLVTARGRPIWVRSVGERECVDGRPARLVGTFQDVTARHLLEAEVQRKSELVTSVIENLPCGLSVFDADLLLVASNTEFRRLLDFPDTLFANEPTRFEDVIRFNAERGEYGPGDTEATVQAIVARARQPTVPHTFERVRPDGTPLEIRGGPMPGGGFVTTYTDISARKRAEAELQHVSALLRGSIDALDGAYSLFDPDDRLVLCNQRYRDLYPLAAEFMVVGNTFEQIMRGGAYRGQYAAAIGREEAWVQERVAVHRQAASDLQTRLADGRTMRILERRMADGHTVGFRVDITAFVRATEAAQEASRSKSQFLANMSHEIRTPMNAILGMLALLKRTALTSRQADYVGKTEGAARSLLGLLNDILDFSKVEAGKMTLDLHPFRPDQLLRDLAVILAANTAGKPIEVLFDIDPQLPSMLVGDAMRLQQVLINLGGNAIKFTAHGEVVVSVSVVERAAEAVTLEIAVRDSGIGIAPEHQQHIFSGFSQAESSTTRRFGGTGLGLSICQRLVGLMGSELRLDSAVGQGSRFHFRIRLAIGDEQGSAELAPQRLRQAVALRVLVVDDNPIARQLMGRMAQGLGWQVVLAESGEAALARMQADDGDFDAVFIDWQMPGLDGLQTCAQIHQRARPGTAPTLIMISAHGREMLTQCPAEKQALVDGFLVKPVTGSMLYDAVVDARTDPDAAAAARPPSASPGRRLAGLRLLVVEDNANNQQVARELLEDEGAEIQIADNGLRAVEAVAAADPPFDVVLMDLQMPVMDGYSATTRIRQDLQKLDLPIVAMTANAMVTDREACLAAGMNDHIGKPFDLNRVDAAAPAGPAAEAAPALSDAVRAAAAAAEVDIERALARLGGKLRVYSRTLRSFTADLQRAPSRLRSQLQQGARDEACRELHTLKGVAATVGAVSLARLAGQTESQLASAPPAAVEVECLTRVAAAIDAAAASMAGLCATLDELLAPAAGAAPDPGPTTLAPADAAVLTGLLRALQRLLRASDLDAIGALQTVRAQVPAAAGGRLDALETAIESLEFESALTTCSEWLEECEA
jgi:two-component system, sensor histidine kinase and response regulator